MVIGPSTGKDISWSPTQLAILGTGDFFQRDYRNSGRRLDKSLPGALSFATIGRHDSLPQNCLPGVGWVPLKSGQIQIQLAGDASITVNRLVVGKGLDRMMVLYWYQAHGRFTHGEHLGQIFLVRDAIQLNRADEALVRIITPVDGENNEAKSEDQAVEFAREILPLLDDYIPH
jgi:EpsI family protein